jgi:tetratricopeptide (TPR) repeat protein
VSLLLFLAVGLGAVLSSLGRAAIETGRQGRNFETFLQAGRLAADERWSDAATLLQRVDRAGLPRHLTWLYDTLLARCLTHVGDVAQAIAHGEQAVRAAEFENDRAAAELALAFAYLQAGRAADALEPAEWLVSIAAPTTPVQAERWYLLGETLRALGRDAEGRVAWERAHAADATSAYGKRAAVRLSATAYR